MAVAAVDGCSKGVAQRVVEAAEAVVVLIGCGGDKLGIVHSAIAVVLQHHVGPAVSHHVHVAQIYHVVLISVDVITVVVEVVERSIEIGAELQSQNTRDDGCRYIVAISSRDYGAIVPHDAWTPLAIRRSDGCMPTPAIVAVVVVPAVAWSAWTHVAVPAIAVVVGSWTAVVDTSVMRSTRTMVVAWTIVATMIAAVSARTVVVGAIVAAVVTTVSTARTVVVVAWAIVAAVVASVAARTMVAIAWVHIAATMVSAMISSVIAARVHIATRSVVASTRTSVAIAIISTGAVVAVARSDDAWSLVATSVNL